MASIRANFFKLTVGCAKRRPQPLREQLLSSITPQMRSSIRSASMLEWLPAEQFAEFHRMVIEGVGEKQATQFWNIVLQEALERPLLTPLRIGALRVFGRNPGSLLRLMPQAWSLVSKGCGGPVYQAEPEVEAQWEGGARVTYRGLPPALDRPAIMRPLWIGGSRATLDCVGHEGEARPVREPEPEGEGIYEVTYRWREA